MPTSKETAFLGAMKMLSANGFVCDVSPKDFSDWLGASTPYPDIETVDLLKRPLLVAHEIAEIAEAKRMGLAITKNVILENPEAIYEAHLNAFETEVILAERMSQWSHILTRLDNLRSWSEDPLLPHRLRPRCKALRAMAEEALREQQKH